MAKAEKTAAANGFAGWPTGLYEFYDGLDEDNSREYFHAHKDVFEQCVRVPMERLLADASTEFGPSHLFRPNRDVRFSKDKRPYKDHCGAVVGGEGRPVYYAQVNGSGIMAAAGYYMMQSDQIARYRAAVADDRTGAELVTIVESLRKSGYEIGSVDLKRVPSSYGQDHPRGQLLKHKSVTMARSWEQPVWLHSKKAADHVVGVWRAAAPLNTWLMAHVGPSAQGHR